MAQTETTTDTLARIRAEAAEAGRLAEGVPGPEWHETQDGGIGCGEAWWERVRIDHAAPDDPEWAEEAMNRQFVVAARLGWPRDARYADAGAVLAGKILLAHELAMYSADFQLTVMRDVDAYLAAVAPEVGP